MRLQLKQKSPGYWQVTIDNPPINLLDREMVDELAAAVDTLEREGEAKVVVFESANRDYFVAHFDLHDATQETAKKTSEGVPVWVDIGQRLQYAPFVSVGVVRGRARGAGSELLQMFDIRFASRERAILSQVEVGCAIFPGGGALERLPRLIGRARALEVVLGADDFDAITAERYGWVNRALPDEELDSFVERFALRVASFDQQAIAEAKAIINQRSGAPVTVTEQADTQARFFRLAGSPQAQERIHELFDRGLQRPGALELDLAELLGPWPAM